MTTLLLATRNAHKVGEIRAILGEGFRYLTLKDFPAAPNVVEDAPTFAGNATKKAADLMEWLAKHPTSNIQHPTPNYILADDSGLEVDELAGKPGVHSARFAALDRSAAVCGAPAAAATNSPDADTHAKLLRLLKDGPAEKRTARFRCVIALVELNSKPETSLPRRSAAKAGNQKLFEGSCEGRIDFAPRGHGGFGYDPLFIPEGFTESFAELGEEVKNQLSHRAKALAKLKAFLAGR